jgi:hypothetical protein
MTEPRRSTPPAVPTEDEWPPDGLNESATFPQNGTGPLEDGPDPFDPAALRVPPDYTTALGVKKVLRVHVRKPAKEWFFRVCADATFQMDTLMIELKEANELYLINPLLLDHLEGESTLTRQRLFFCVNRQGLYFFWGVKLPGVDGRMTSASKSALEAAELAVRSWVRMAWEPSLQGYNIWQAAYSLEPEWPERAMKDLLRIAFHDYYIDTWDHPVLRQLRGEV